MAVILYFLLRHFVLRSLLRSYTSTVFVIVLNSSFVFFSFHDCFSFLPMGFAVINDNIISGSFIAIMVRIT